MDNLKVKKIRNVSISFTLIWLFGLLVYYIFTQFIQVTLLDTIAIVIFETILYLIMLIFFIHKIDWLKDIETQKEFTHLNISNFLSAIRFSLVPLLIVLFNITMREPKSFKIKLVLLIFAALICITDLFDGLLARKLNEVTKLGMILDPMGDFLMITCFTVLIFHHSIINWWFFVLIMIRIPLFVIIMIYLTLIRFKFKIETSLLGKATIFYLSVFLAFAAIKLFFDRQNEQYELFLLILQIIGAILVILSIIEKFKIFFGYSKEQKK